MNSTILVIAILLAIWTLIEFVAFVVQKKAPEPEADPVTMDEAQELSDYLFSGREMMPEPDECDCSECRRRKV